MRVLGLIALSIFCVSQMAFADDSHLIFRVRNGGFVAAGITIQQGGELKSFGTNEAVLGVLTMPLMAVIRGWVSDFRANAPTLIHLSDPEGEARCAANGFPPFISYAIPAVNDGNDFITIAERKGCKLFIDSRPTAGILVNLLDSLNAIKIETN